MKIIGLRKRGKKIVKTATLPYRIQSTLWGTACGLLR